ncbi:MAG TPA: hypothetical protein PLW11_06785 [Bacillota bacterium]|nr:hypothetical protein [Bacillota bacterium]
MIRLVKVCPTGSRLPESITARVWAVTGTGEKGRGSEIYPETAINVENSEI